MDYLIHAFINELKNYKRFITFQCTKLSNGSYRFILSGINPDLYCRLIDSTYIEKVEYYYTTDKGIKKKGVMENIHPVILTVDIDNNDNLIVILDKKSYNEKMKTISIILREYNSDMFEEEMISRA